MYYTVCTRVYLLCDNKNNKNNNNSNHNILRPLRECPSILLLRAFVFIVIHYCIMFNVMWWLAA